MKHLSYLAFLTLLLSGCGNLYGPYNAPVVDRNVRYGQPPVRNINQPQSPRVISRQVVSSQVVRQPVGQVPAPVIGQTQVAQGSPYRPAPAQVRPTTPQPNNNGWNVKPQTGNSVVIVDEPKVSNPTPPSVPAAPVIRKPVENTALVDEPKLTPPPTTKKESSDSQQNAVKPANAVPDELKVVKKPESEPEKPKRPAPLRPKVANNSAEDTVVEKAPTPRQSEEVATRVPTPAAPSGKTAVSSLLKKAADSLGKGKLDEAVAYLENAQRVDPKNSKILYDIANIRYHQGRYRDAENFAGKASQLGGGSMAKKSWRLISKAREALGDKQGALQAAEKAAQ